MKKILFAIVLSLTALKVSAYDFLRAVKDSIPGGYNFWVYTPVDYFYSQEQTPVIIFLQSKPLRKRPLARSPLWSSRCYREGQGHRCPDHCASEPWWCMEP